MSGISASRTGRDRVLVVDGDGRSAPWIARGCAPQTVVRYGMLPGLQSPPCPGAERQEPSARVVSPSARHTIGPTESGR